MDQALILMEKKAHKKEAGFARLVLSRWRMKLYMLSKLPLGLIAGLRVDRYDAGGASVSVPYRYITKNPFRSVYFAPLSMAAELSSGLLALEAVQQAEKPVSMLVMEMHAYYLKKAKSRITFRCNDRQALQKTVAATLNSNEGQTFVSTVEGFDIQGNSVAKFEITWTFKQK